MSNEVKVRVSAAADPSLRSVYKPLEVAAAKARAMVDKEMAAMAKEAKAEASAAAKVRARVADEVAKHIARAAKQETDAVLRERKRQVEGDLKAFDERLKASRRFHKDQERVAASASRDASGRLRDRRGKFMNDPAFEAGKRREHLARDFGWRGVNNLGSVARGAANLGREFGQGIGVDYSVQGLTSRNVELERRAQNLANQGYQAGGDPKGNGTRRTGASVAEDIRAAADATGFDRLTAAEGLGQFVDKTGDLKLGVSILKDMGVLAKATGGDLSDMAAAAGDVAMQLDHVPAEKKAAAIGNVMRVIAAQGKLGAVEVKDLATLMAKLTSSAGSFEGDVEKNIGFMGALVQMSKAKGGSASAAQAATSVASFTNTLKTPARMAAFKDAGVDILNQKTGNLKSPEEIILASLSATRGSPEAFKKLFANVQGARAVEGSAQTYRDARAEALDQGANENDANEAGLAAVKAEFDKFSKATLGATEVQDSFTNAMNTTAVKATLFNSKLEDVARGAGDRLAPALEKAAPGLLVLAQYMANFVSFAAENPWSAVGVALGAAVAKAGIETTLRSGFEALLKRAFSGAAAGNGKTGGGMGNLGAGLTIAATAVTITAMGVTLIDQAMDRKDKADQAGRDSVDSAASRRASAITQTFTSSGLQDLIDLKSELQGKMALAEEGKKYTSSNPLTQNANGISAALNWMTAGSVGTSGDRQAMAAAAAQQQEQLRAELTKTTAAILEMKAKLAGNLMVTVTNPQAAVIGPTVDQAARTPPGPP